jgi:hypothetical protein
MSRHLPMLATPRHHPRVPTWRACRPDLLAST